MDDGVEAAPASPAADGTGKPLQRRRSRPGGTAVGPTLDRRPIAGRHSLDSDRDPAIDRIARRVPVPVVVGVRVLAA